MKKRTFVIAVVTLLILALALTVTACKKKEEPVVETPVETTVEPKPVEAIPETVVVETPPEPEEAYHPLISKRYPWAIMINNHADARPQSGMTTASLIYEILVEGRMTRLLMITEDEEALIGPIRSARPAFFDHVLEWQAFYSHVGNYEYVQQHPYGDEIKDMDQFYHAGRAYYRETHRVAPHNMYAPLDLLYEAAEAEGYQIELPEEGLQHFNQYDKYHDYGEAPAALSISFSYDNYTGIDYRWNEEKQMYEKFINGREMVEEFTNEVIEIGNLIILRRPHSKMPNGVHERVEYLGKGEAMYFTGGKMYALTWEKEDHKTPTKYFIDGKELILNPGLTFINVVPDSLEVKIDD
ncbi:MAG TPA: DUF3048 domain-containing protein [Tissierellia bacterium]|nr:DUF3048 domain-containing protein [Tissierellia bacterium]